MLVLLQMIITIDLETNGGHIFVWDSKQNDVTITDNYTDKADCPVTISAQQLMNTSRIIEFLQIHKDNKEIIDG